MNNLTTIASIPQGGGCASKLPAEVSAGNAKVIWTKDDERRLDETIAKHYPPVEKRDRSAENWHGLQVASAASVLVEYMEKRRNKRAEQALPNPAQLRSLASKQKAE